MYTAWHPFRGVSAPASLKHVGMMTKTNSDMRTLSGALAPRPH